MTGPRVLRAPSQPEAAPRRDGRLQVGGHYRLPSGNTVELEVVSGGGAVAQCKYGGKASTVMVARGDEVSFVAEWLRRYGQLSWGG